MDNEMGTKEKILHFGKQEFLHNGFKNASLRDIAAAAGMTTGAIYTYFEDKNALFEAIVDPICKQVEDIFCELSASYYNADGIISEITTQKTITDLQQIYKFIYNNFDVFSLLITGAEGSSKADFVHTIVEYETAHTLAYLDRMKTDRSIDISPNRTVIHTISESYINALLEPVRHGMRYEQAVENLDFVCVFYTGGWKSVFREIFAWKI